MPIIYFRVSFEVRSEVLEERFVQPTRGNAGGVDVRVGGLVKEGNSGGREVMRRRRDAGGGGEVGY